MPVSNIKAGWSSGSLVFFEKAIGRSTTGDILTVGTTGVSVGNTGNDIDLTIYTGSAATAKFDYGTSTLIMTATGISFSGTVATAINFGSATITTDITKAGNMTISTTGTTKNLTLSTTGDIALNPAGADITIGGVSGSAGKLTAHATQLTVAGGDTSGDDLILKANTSDSDAITISGGATVTIAATTDIALNPTGADITIGGVSGSAGKLTAHETKLTIYGGDTAGDDLVLQANSSDSEVITLNGGGAVAITNPNGATFSAYVTQGTSADDGCLSFTDSVTNFLGVYTGVQSGGADITTGTPLSGIRSRMLINKAQTNDTSWYPIYGQLRIKADRSQGIGAAVRGYVEESGDTTMAAGQTSALLASVEVSSGFTLSAGNIEGLRVESLADASATMTGAFNGIYIAKGSGKLEFDYGIYIDDAATRSIYSNTTPAGSSAINAWECTVTDACTTSSGYAHAIHVTANNTGAKSGGCSVTQFNPIGVDLTLTEAGSAGFYALYAYIMKSGSPDCSGAAVAGVNVELTELGAIDYYAGLWVNKYNTTKATGPDAFCLFSNQGSGVTRAGFYFQGGKPDYLIQTANDATDNMIVKGAGTYSTADGYIKIYLATTEYRIPIYAGVD